MSGSEVGSLEAVAESRHFAPGDQVIFRSGRYWKLARVVTGIPPGESPPWLPDEGTSEGVRYLVMNDRREGYVLEATDMKKVEEGGHG